ncbi:2-hydroxyisoflavanone dehydratase [Spatholobus suberectus]|nr:2-hydroxyisoflavanone dehydratase [Spatholobus suberectus]
MDNPMCNPVAPGAPSLAGLGCSRMIVCVAGRDSLRERGIWYYESVKKSGWQGKLEFFEEKDVGHTYHLSNVESENTKKLIKHLASFLQE